MYESTEVDRGSLNHVRRKVEGPAVALMLCSGLSLLVLLVGLAFSAWLLVSGTAADMRQPPGMSKETQILVRMGWNVTMEITNAIILLGAIQMRRLKSPGLSRSACVLAVIPCLGPCFLLGIPFGIWGLVVLNDPQVKRAFDAVA